MTKPADRAWSLLHYQWNNTPISFSHAQKVTPGNLTCPPVCGQCSHWPSLCPFIAVKVPFGCSCPGHYGSRVSHRLNHNTNLWDRQTCAQLNHPSVIPWRQMFTRKQQLGNIRPKTFKQHATLLLPYQHKLKTGGKHPQADLFLRQAPDTSSQQHTPATVLSGRDDSHRTAVRVSPRVGFDVAAKRTTRVSPKIRSPAVKYVASEFMDRSILTHAITILFNRIYP